MAIVPHDVASATGTDEITIATPGLTEVNDRLVICLLFDTLVEVNTTGWFVLGNVNDQQMVAITRIWDGVTPSYTFGPGAGATVSIALVFAFGGAFPTPTALGSIPSGGADPTKIECPGGAFGGMHIAFGGTTTQADDLDTEPPLSGYTRHTGGGLWLVAGIDFDPSPANRFFTGLDSGTSGMGIGGVLREGDPGGVLVRPLRQRQKESHPRQKQRAVK